MNVDGFRTRNLLIPWYEGVDVVSVPLHFVVMGIRKEGPSNERENYFLIRPTFLEVK
jgi:hypothetical protein